MTSSATQTQVDVGHAKGAHTEKRHVVIQVQSGWALLCTQKPATHERGKHFLTKEEVTCKACFEAAQEAISHVA